MISHQVVFYGSGELAIVVMKNSITVLAGNLVEAKKFYPIYATQRNRIWIKTDGIVGNLLAVL
jgi:hypothetical protein